MTKAHLTKYIMKDTIELVTKIPLDKCMKDQLY